MVKDRRRVSFNRRVSVKKINESSSETYNYNMEINTNDSCDLTSNLTQSIKQANLENLTKFKKKLQNEDLGDNKSEELRSSNINSNSDMLNLTNNGEITQNQHSDQFSKDSEMHTDIKSIDFCEFEREDANNKLEEHILNANNNSEKDYLAGLNQTDSKAASFSAEYRNSDDFLKTENIASLNLSSAGESSFENQLTSDLNSNSTIENSKTYRFQDSEDMGRSKEEIEDFVQSNNFIFDSKILTDLSSIENASKFFENITDCRSFIANKPARRSNSSILSFKKPEISTNLQDKTLNTVQNTANQSIYKNILNLNTDSTRTDSFENNFENHSEIKSEHTMKDAIYEKDYNYGTADFMDKNEEQKLRTLHDLCKTVKPGFRTTVSGKTDYDPQIQYKTDNRIDKPLKETKDDDSLLSKYNLNTRQAKKASFYSGYNLKTDHLGKLSFSDDDVYVKQTDERDLEMENTLSSDTCLLIPEKFANNAKLEKRQYSEFNHAFSNDICMQTPENTVNTPKLEKKHHQKSKNTFISDTRTLTSGSTVNVAKTQILNDLASKPELVPDFVLNDAPSETAKKFNSDLWTRTNSNCEKTRSIGSAKFTNSSQPQPDSDIRNQKFIPKKRYTDVLCLKESMHQPNNEISDFGQDFYAPKSTARTKFFSFISQRNSDLCAFEASNIDFLQKEPLEYVVKNTTENKNDNSYQLTSNSNSINQGVSGESEPYSTQFKTDLFTESGSRGVFDSVDDNQLLQQFSNPQKNSEAAFLQPSCLNKYNQVELKYQKTFNTDEQQYRAIVPAVIGINSSIDPTKTSPSLGNLTKPFNKDDKLYQTTSEDLFTASDKRSKVLISNEGQLDQARTRKLSTDNDQQGRLPAKDESNDHKSIITSAIDSQELYPQENKSDNTILQNTGSFESQINKKSKETAALLQNQITLSETSVKDVPNNLDLENIFDANDTFTKNDTEADFETTNFKTDLSDIENIFESSLNNTSGRTSMLSSRRTGDVAIILNELDLKLQEYEQKTPVFNEKNTNLMKANPPFQENLDVLTIEETPENLLNNKTFCLSTGDTKENQSHNVPLYKFFEETKRNQSISTPTGMVLEMPEQHGVSNLPELVDSTLKQSDKTIVQDSTNINESCLTENLRKHFPLFSIDSLLNTYRITFLDSFKKYKQKIDNETIFEDSEISKYGKYWLKNVIQSLDLSSRTSLDQIQKNKEEIKKIRNCNVYGDITGDRISNVYLPSLKISSRVKSKYFLQKMKIQQITDLVNVLQQQESILNANLEHQNIIDDTFIHKNNELKRKYFNIQSAYQDKKNVFLSLFSENFCQKVIDLLHFNRKHVDMQLKHKQMITEPQKRTKELEYLLVLNDYIEKCNLGTVINAKITTYDKRRLEKALSHAHLSKINHNFLGLIEISSKILSRKDDFLKDLSHEKVELNNLKNELVAQKRILKQKTRDVTEEDIKKENTHLLILEKVTKSQILELKILFKLMVRGYLIEISESFFLIYFKNKENQEFLKQKFKESIISIDDIEKGGLSEIIDDFNQYLTISQESIKFKDIIDKIWEI